VRLAAPFDHAIAAGLRKTAELCVRHCPTGALVLADPVAKPKAVTSQTPSPHSKT
jgi:hypothetical protein